MQSNNEGSSRLFISKKSTTHGSPDDRNFGHTINQSENGTEYILEARARVHPSPDRNSKPSISFVQQSERGADYILQASCIGIVGSIDNVIHEKAMVVVLSSALT